MGSVMSGSRIPYFDFYPTDFMHGVRGLTPQEVGIYTMLLCRIYEENAPVQYHPARLAAYCGTRESTFVKAFERLVDLGKFSVSEGMFTNARAQVEIAARETKLKNNSRAGKLSAQKRQQKQIDDATGVQRPSNHTDTDTDTDKRVDANASTCADGVKPPSFDEFWSSWPLGKVGKDAARKAFGRLSPQQRIGATTRAVAWCGAWRAANPRLNDIHPSTYLNNKRWEDEAQPVIKVISGGPRDQSPQQNRQSAADDRFGRIADAAVRNRAPSRPDFGFG